MAGIPEIDLRNGCRTACLIAAMIFAAGCGRLSGGPGKPSMDFSLSATPGSASVVAGQGASFIVQVDPAAMIGQVNLGVSGLPPGVQAAFSPGFDVVEGSRTLNVFTTSATPAAVSQLTITATTPGVTHTATANLAITPAADFALAVTPNLQTIKPGGSASYQVRVSFTGGATGPVHLNVAALPTGVTASFDRSTVTGTGTATLTLSADSTIRTLIQPMDVVGTDNSGRISASFSLAIIPADFALNQTVGPVEVNAGGVVNGSILVSGLFATPGAVTLSAGALPAGITVSFNPIVVNGSGSSAINIATDISTAPGAYSLLIHGMDASGTNIIFLPVTVVASNPGAGVFLSASPLIESVRSGQSAFFNIHVSSPGGPVPPLTFRLTLPPDVDGSIFQTGTDPAAYGLSLSTSPFSSSTGGAVTVTAIGPGGSQSITVNLAIDSTP